MGFILNALSVALHRPFFCPRPLGSIRRLPAKQQAMNRFTKFQLEVSQNH